MSERLMASCTVYQLVLGARAYVRSWKVRD
jgi:hypothetical protein